MIYFAGPVQLELPWPFVLMILFMFIAILVGGIIFLITLSKSALKIRKKNIQSTDQIIAVQPLSDNLNKRELPSSNFKIGDYIVALLMETIMFTFLVFLFLYFILPIMNYDLKWNTAALVTTIQISSFLFVAFRATLRLLTNSSVGEMLIHAPKPDHKHIFYVFLAEVTIGLAGIFAPVILSTSV